MKVKFLGGRGVSGLNRADGTRLAVGEVADMPPRVIALFRARGYQFESQEDDPLPPPAATPPPVEDSAAERQRLYQESEAELAARERAEAEAAAQAQLDKRQEPDEP